MSERSSFFFPAFEMNPDDHSLKKFDLRLLQKKLAFKCYKKLICFAKIYGKFLNFFVLNLNFKKAI